ncbi:MAG: hypothetical protein PQJ61_00610 [Spirochaetales bacterium]|uniref:TonB-dependent receptor n=1 Tax=Candidatus Thalassospirochaeta sargassi TaxID=3119039 RepID=A0AAJ1MM71_9SPIO|nr:hypothetical protein [Spirochaetales bacterium]
MNRFFKPTVTAAFFLFTAASIFAAEGDITGPDEPAETEIILPRMYLEIEDLTIEEIDAVIPDDAAVMLSSIELPLPEPDQIVIPAEAFALSDSDVPGIITTTDAGQQGSSFFSEGTIGAGTSAHITGDINLYHIGSQPDFRLRYFHDSSDGFAGSEAGEGFSSREELIEAELNYTDEALSADILIDYNEFENGLQGQTDYFSVTRRIPELAGGATWQLSDLFSLTGEVDAFIASMQLNDLSPASYSTYAISPEAGILLGSDKYNTGLSLNYELNGPSGGVDQQLGAALDFSLNPVDIFNADGEVGILWDNYSSLYYPFQLELSGTASSFEYEISGGYSAFYRDRREIWEIFPAAAGPESEASLGDIPLTTGWDVFAGFRWNLSDNMRINASAGFSKFENALMPTGSAVSGFSSFSAVDSTCLDASVGIYLKITENFDMSAGWEGQLLDDMDWFSPRHLFTGSAEMKSADRDMGIIGDISLSIYDEEQSWYTNDWMPELGLEGYIRLSEGFVFSVTAKDFAAGLLENGRTAWGDYLEEGAMLQAKIKMSL